MRSVFRGLRRCLRDRSAQKPCSHRARAVVCRPIVECLEDRSLPSVGFVETPLVSNIPGLAAHTDPDLLNPWGFIETPQGQFRVAANGAGNAPLITAEGEVIGPAIVLPPPPGAVALGG
jgi:hypothetical protein